MPHPNDTDIEHLWSVIGVMALMAPVVGAYARLKLKQIQKALDDLGIIADHNHKRLNSLENGELTNRIKEVLANRREEMRISDVNLPIADRRELINRRHIGEDSVGKK